ncbi:hypothetical protein LTR08_008643 [Meristemomyces frigidus]|nr:hypothetical protein LTR08_008643 [Meristemomyces frigidus]
MATANTHPNKATAPPKATRPNNSRWAMRRNRNTNSSNSSNRRRDGAAAAGASRRVWPRCVVAALPKRGASAVPIAASVLRAAVRGMREKRLGIGRVGESV